ncbi:hypothetical protein AAE478_003833 [Parahypoxylon ruwenzoriense]
MGDQVYARSGRGGAGNFYTRQEIAAATKKAAKHEDLEAQHGQPLPSDNDDNLTTDPADAPLQRSTTTASTASSTGDTKTYARSGRGGAGNFFVDSSMLPSPPSPSSPKPSPPRPPRTQIRSAGLTGRGGAGNWTATAQQQGEDGGEGGEEEEYDPEQERRRRAALDAHILEDIRDSLPQPPRIHYMHGPGRGRKPDMLPT